MFSTSAVSGAMSNGVATIATTLSGMGAGMGHGAAGTPSTTITTTTPHPVPASVWPTVAGAVDQLFTVFDTNKNGTIALNEITAVLDPGGHHDELNSVVAGMVALIDTSKDNALTKAEVTAAFTRLDTNGDGSLSPADLGPALAMAGMTPLLAALLQGMPLPGGGTSNPMPPTAPTVTQVVDVLITRFDADKDKAVTLKELLAVLDPKAQHAHLDELLKDVVGAVDANKDGKMSQAELVAAISSLDSDGNGSLDHRDHVPGPPADDSLDLIGVLLPHMRDFDVDTLGHFS